MTSEELRELNCCEKLAELERRVAVGEGEDEGEELVLQSQYVPSVPSEASRKRQMEIARLELIMDGHRKKWGAQRPAQPVQKQQQQQQMNWWGRLVGRDRV